MCNGRRGHGETVPERAPAASAGSGFGLTGPAGRKGPLSSYLCCRFLEVPYGGAGLGVKGERLHGQRLRQGSERAQRSPKSRPLGQACRAARVLAQAALAAPPSQLCGVGHAWGRCVLGQVPAHSSPSSAGRERNETLWRRVRNLTRRSSGHAPAGRRVPLSSDVSRSTRIVKHTISACHFQMPNLRL